MRRTKLNFGKFHWANFPELAAVAILFTGCFRTRSIAAFVAYPAEYRSSGVMTFIVGADGVVYQKDLGKKTEVLAKGMKEYNPDSTWQKTGEQEETAAESKANGKK